jgi:hypothetical protein
MKHEPIVDGFMANAARYVSRCEADDIRRTAAHGKKTGGLFGLVRG